MCCLTESLESTIFNSQNAKLLSKQADDLYIKLNDNANSKIFAPVQACKASSETDANV